MGLKANQYTLRFDRVSGAWLLQHVKSEKIIKRFRMKDAATKAGVLKRAIGGEGSVIIRGKSGVFEEERFFS